MVHFTYLCKLDDKNRIVIPQKLRQSLGILDSVQLEIKGSNAILKQPCIGGSFLKSSKNISEAEGPTNGRCSVAVSTSDCGSGSPSSILGIGPIAFSRNESLKTIEELIKQ